MRDVRAIFGPELVAAIERLVDERVEARLATLTVDASSPWMTVAEAAVYVRASDRTVERLVTGKRIRSTTLGRRRLLYRDDLDVYLRSNRANGDEGGEARTAPPRRRGVG